VNRLRSILPYAYIVGTALLVWLLVWVIVFGLWPGLVALS